MFDLKENRWEVRFWRQPITWVGTKGPFAGLSVLYFFSYLFTFLFLLKD